MVGQDAAGLRGRLETEGAAVREGTRVHLVPVEREQVNNVLRYSETFVKSDGKLNAYEYSSRPVFYPGARRAANRHGHSAAAGRLGSIARAKLDGRQKRRTRSWN